MSQSPHVLKLAESPIAEEKLEEIRYVNKTDSRVHSGF